MKQEEIERIEAMIARAAKAEVDRKALVQKYNVDFSPEADAEIRKANNEKMVAEALLSAAAVMALPELLAIAKKANES